MPTPDPRATPSTEPRPHGPTAPRRPHRCGRGRAVGRFGQDRLSGVDAADTLERLRCADQGSLQWPGKIPAQADNGSGLRGRGLHPPHEGLGPAPAHLGELAAQARSGPRRADPRALACRDFMIAPRCQCVLEHLSAAGSAGRIEGCREQPQVPPCVTQLNMRCATQERSLQPPYPLGSPRARAQGRKRRHQRRGALLRRSRGSATASSCSPARTVARPKPLGRPWPRVSRWPGRGDQAERASSRLRADCVAGAAQTSWSPRGRAR